METRRRGTGEEVGLISWRRKRGRHARDDAPVPAPSTLLPALLGLLLLVVLVLLVLTYV
ncbi:hypothetical protein [Umezawaea beigongshangensis]|uniref:hypothetical protein n=1 Tax=Umezawaea beigongshangensis TaxID=2780383 RepID=UPI0018F19694|nr:hypothetical protein [Umezawaea beigongshangensis]